MHTLYFICTKILFINNLICLLKTTLICHTAVYDNNKICFSSLILNAIMVAFKPSSISSRAMQFLEIINASTKEDLPSYRSLCTFGLCISECPPPTEQKRQILGLVWKHISTINIAEHYISCVEVWMSFTMQHVSVSIQKYSTQES